MTSGIGRKGSQQFQGKKQAAGGPRASVGGATGITAMSSTANKNKGPTMHATQMLGFNNTKNSVLFNHSQGMSNMSHNMMQPTPPHFHNKLGSGSSNMSGGVFAGGQTVQHPQSTTYHQGWTQNPAGVGGPGGQPHSVLSPYHQGGGPQDAAKATHFQAQKLSAPEAAQNGSQPDRNQSSAAQAANADNAAPHEAQHN